MPANQGIETGFLKEKKNGTAPILFQCPRPTLKEFLLVNSLL